MVGEPTVFWPAGSTLRRRERRGRGRRAAARAGADDQDAQEIERLRLATSLRRSRWSTSRADPPGMRESEVGAMFEGTCMRSERLPGKVALRARSRSSGRGRDPHVHRDRRPAGARRRADPARNLGLRDGYWSDLTRTPAPARCARNMASCSTACSAFTARRSPMCAGREPRGARHAGRDGIAHSATRPAEPPDLHGVGARP